MNNNLLNEALYLAFKYAPEDDINCLLNNWIIRSKNNALWRAIDSNICKILSLAAMSLMFFIQVPNLEHINHNLVNFIFSASLFIFCISMEVGQKGCYYVDKSYKVMDGKGFFKK